MADYSFLDISGDVSQLGRRLREAREGAGVTQGRLAELTGIGQGRIALIEHGKVDVRASTLAKIVQALRLQLVAVDALTARRLDAEARNVARGPRFG